MRDLLLRSHPQKDWLPSVHNREFHHKPCAALDHWAPALHWFSSSDGTKTIQIIKKLGAQSIRVRTETHLIDLINEHTEICCLCIITTQVRMTSLHTIVIGFLDLCWCSIWKLVTYIQNQPIIRHQTYKSNHCTTIRNSIFPYRFNSLNPQIDIHH